MTDLIRKYIPGEGWQTVVDDGGGSRPYIDDTETGLVVNRAGGFVSAWEAFDLLEPGVGYGKATVTAADGDGEIWADTIQAQLGVGVSSDGVAYVALYDVDSAPGLNSVVAALVNTVKVADPVGGVVEYMTFSPRFIRFRVVIVDLNSGEIYAGANDPSLTFTFHYTAS